MKNRIFFSLQFFLFTLTGSISAQQNNSEIVMTIGDTKVSIEEFENVYHKNSNLKTDRKDKSLEEYVGLFVNFKLKVKDAEAEGLDTVPKFITELAGYRRQLANTYLTDGEVNDMLIKETYDRLKEEICVSHILVKCPEMALPKDSLKAYNRIWSIYNKIEKGSSFEKLASDAHFNDDTTLLKANGFIGCFTAMDLVYSFETVAYNTKVGEISKPVRTRFGYHIIKVIDKRKAHGEILVAHMMLKNTPPMSHTDSVNQEKKINELYQKLKNGEDFEKLAKEYSEDKGSAPKGGQLPWIGINKTPAEFEKAAFSLKTPGEFSTPVRTPYGIHIIKLIDKKELGDFEDEKGDLKMKLSRISRFSVGQTAFIEKLKSEYNFQQNNKALEEFYKLIDTSLFYGKWDATKAVAIKKPLFNIKDVVFTVSDFASYIERKQRKSERTDIKMAVDNLFEQYANEMILNYEDEHLEEKYPKFKALMQEYRDGILLFEITNKKVWTKAVKDTAGLLVYYENNKNKYTWGERADASIYKCANHEIAGKVRKMINKGKSEAEILKSINKKSQLNLSIESKHFSQGENQWVDKNWDSKVSGDLISETDNKVLIVQIKNKLKNEVKAFEDTKGAVISDYQNYLEKEWLEALKKKYVVQINEQALTHVK